MIPFGGRFNQNNCRACALCIFVFFQLPKQVWKLSENKNAPFGAIVLIGGERGIRTPGSVARTTVFKTAALDHSAISPGTKVVFSNSP